MARQKCISLPKLTDNCVSFMLHCQRKSIHLASGRKQTFLGHWDCLKSGCSHTSQWMKTGKEKHLPFFNQELCIMCFRCIISRNTFGSIQTWQHLHSGAFILLIWSQNLVPCCSQKRKGAAVNLFSLMLCIDCNQ